MQHDVRGVSVTIKGRLLNDLMDAVVGAKSAAESFRGEVLAGDREGYDYWSAEMLRYISAANDLWVLVRRARNKRDKARRELFLTRRFIRRINKQVVS